MTTGNDKAHEEYERLMQEVRLANARETHRLLTSAWQQKAPSIAAAVMTLFAGVGVALLLAVAVRQWAP